MFELAGLSFHLYGLILGVSVAVGWGLVLVKAKHHQLSLADLDYLASWVLVAGLVGARVYHVLTDFHLYQHQWVEVLYIWRGGLSIFGALLGGVIGAGLGLKVHRLHLTLPQILDLAVFGVPVAQAIGRWGNFINQELYGWPTQLPWGISIAPDKRPVGFENQATYHPLFAYEILLLLGFAVWIWWTDRRAPFKIGSLAYFLRYVLFYSAVRFGLDFIRIDKTSIGSTGLGLNQVMMLGVLIGVSIYWWRRNHEQTRF